MRELKGNWLLQTAAATSGPQADSVKAYKAALRRRNGVPPGLRSNGPQQRPRKKREEKAGREETKTPPDSQHFVHGVDEVSVLSYR
jgi:hypothetical protein